MSAKWNPEYRFIVPIDLPKKALFHEISTMGPRVKRANNSSSLSSFGI